MLFFSFLTFLNTSMISKTAPKVVKSLSSPCMQGLKIQAKKVLYAKELDTRVIEELKVEPPPNPCNFPNLKELRKLNTIKDINLLPKTNYGQFCSKIGEGEELKDVDLDFFISKKHPKNNK